MNTEQIVTISIASQFSRVPAGRVRSDGPYSGERFRDEFLVPRLREGRALRIDFDGARGYGSSFLEEAFGGLIRNGFATADDLSQRLEFVSNEDPTLIDEVLGYIRKAGDRKK